MFKINQSARGWGLISSIIVMFLISGCADVSRFDKRLDKGAVAAFSNSDSELYSHIRIRLSPDKANSHSNFYLKLPHDGPILSFKEITLPVVRKYFLPSAVYKPGEAFLGILTDHELEFDIGDGYTLYLEFKDGMNLDFITLHAYCYPGHPHCYSENQANGSSKSRIMIGANPQRMYALPLSLEQMVDVFGPPDRVHNVIQTTYDMIDD